MSDAPTKSSPPTRKSRQRNTRNTTKNRNQIRTENLNIAYEKLKKQLPKSRRGKIKWTKLLILRMAINYIRSLQYMLGSCQDAKAARRRGEVFYPAQEQTEGDHQRVDAVSEWEVQPSQAKQPEPGHHFESCNYMVPISFHPPQNQLYCSNSQLLHSQSAGHEFTVRGGTETEARMEEYEEMNSLTYDDDFLKRLIQGGAAAQPPNQACCEGDWRLVNDQTAFAWEDSGVDWRLANNHTACAQWVDSCEENWRLVNDQTVRVGSACASLAINESGSFLFA